MSDIYFFDTDCLSSFLMINQEDILLCLYGDRIFVSSQVYSELRLAPDFVKETIDFLIKNERFKLITIDYGTKEYKEYIHLTKSTQCEKLIGKGEASAIALCKTKGGVLASNNLKDVSYYINKYKLKSTTTSDILCDAYDLKIVDHNSVKKIWVKMIPNNKMPEKTFDDYYKKKKIAKRLGPAEGEFIFPENFDDIDISDDFSGEIFPK